MSTRLADRHEDRRIGRQTGRQTDNDTDTRRQVDRRHTNRKTDINTDIDRQTVRQTNRKTDMYLHFMADRHSHNCSRRRGSLWDGPTLKTRIGMKTYSKKVKSCYIQSKLYADNRNV